MSRVDFAASRKLAEKEGYVQGGDYFKIREGANRVRLLSVPLPHQGSYRGTPNFKWLCYVLDREDGQVKVWFMPHTIFKAIEGLQQTDDYSFDEIPMPYDITVNAKGAGTKEVDYSVVPARKNTPLTAQEITLLDAKKPIAEVQTAIRVKAGAEEAPAPQSFDPEAVPF